MKEPFVWDACSDQPYQIKERAFKKAMRKKVWPSLLATAVTAVVMLPLSLLAIPFTRPKRVESGSFFGMGVNLDKEPSLTPQLIDELGVTSLLIRFNLWEMERLDEQLGFVRSFENKKIILNIMQDREHIEDLARLKSDLQTIFDQFSPHVTAFQIGTTINRAKWGFFSVGEYLAFYKTAYDLKKNDFPGINLIGSCVIDFEYHFTAHTLFNFFSLKYDGIAALLYVDRRGAPENTQMGFDLSKKIAWLAGMVTLSPKSAKRIFITETNWPISGTAPYAPTSEHECVDEESYADYMVRYYLLAFASRQIEGVYWHQLIAPGYGLVDNREGIRKRSAFAAFKTMVAQLGEAHFERLVVENDCYTISCRTPRGLLQIIWSPTAKETLSFNNDVRCIDRDGKEAHQRSCTIDSSPVYIYPEPN